MEHIEMLIEIDRKLDVLLKISAQLDQVIKLLQGQRPNYFMVEVKSEKQSEDWAPFYFPINTAGG